MEGCSWDPETMALVDSPPGQIYTKTPYILFEPIDSHYVEPDDYLIPFYKASSREGTYLFNVEWPTKKPSEYWTLRGAALFCHIKDK